jgi:hypothetical protein
MMTSIPVPRILSALWPPKSATAEPGSSIVGERCAAAIHAETINSRSGRIFANVGITGEHIKFRHVLRIGCLAEERNKANRHTTTFQFIVPPNECFYCASAPQNARHHVRCALQAGKRRYAIANLCCLNRCGASRGSCKNQSIKCFFTKIYTKVWELF